MASTKGMDSARRRIAHGVTGFKVRDVPLIFLVFGYLGFPGNASGMLGGTGLMLWSMASELLLIIGGLVSIVFLAKRAIGSKGYTGLLGLFVIFAASAVCSAIASSDVNEALHNTLLFLCLISLGVFVGTKCELDEILGIVLSAHILLLVLYAFLFLTNPSVLFQGDYFVGLYSSKNNCAYELGLATLVCVAKYSGVSSVLGRGALVGLVAINVSLCFSADCVGVLVAFCFAALMGFLATRLGVRPRLGNVHLAMMAVFFFVVFMVLPGLSDLLELFGKDATLTGRIYIWDVLFNMIAESNTALGYGYGMFWHHEPEAIYWYRAALHYGLGQYTGAHSLMLEMWLNVGLIGLVAYTALSVLPLNRSWAIKGRVYQFALSYVVFYTFKSFVERTSNVSYDVLLLFVIVGMIVVQCSRFEKRRLSFDGDGREVGGLQ